MPHGPQELYLPIYPTVRNTYDTDKQHKAGKDKEELLENNYRQMMKRDREDPEKGDDYVSKAQPSQSPENVPTVWILWCWWPFVGYIVLAFVQVKPDIAAISQKETWYYQLNMAKNVWNLIWCDTPLGLERSTVLTSRTIGVSIESGLLYSNPLVGESAWPATWRVKFLQRKSL